MNTDKPPPLQRYDLPRTGMDITASTPDTVTIKFDPSRTGATGCINNRSPSQKQLSKKRKAKKRVKRKMTKTSRRRNR